jgi:hypothetical protein
MGYLGANDAATKAELILYWTAAKLTIPPAGWTDTIVGFANRLAESDIDQVMRQYGFGTIASTQLDFPTLKEIDATLTYYRLNHNEELYKEWMQRLYRWGLGHGCTGSKSRSAKKCLTSDSLTGESGYGTEAL